MRTIPSVPVILIFMIKLINDPEIMGEHVNGPVYNVVVWATAVVLIIMTGLLLLTTVFPRLFG